MIERFLKMPNNEQDLAVWLTTREAVSAEDPWKQPPLG
jgi:hypothetical protein